MIRHPKSGFRHVAASLLAGSLLVVAFPFAAEAAAPVNDAFAAATVATEPLPFADSTNTTHATLEAGEPPLGDRCGAGVERTVWYSYEPSTDTVVSANTFGSDFDTVLGVWKGTDIDALSLVRCNDDSQDLQSSVLFLAEAGADYRIQIGGFGGSSGNLEFNLREAPAGAVQGSVTDEGSAPLGGICVVARDTVFGQSEDFTRTAADGTYELVLRSSTYLVRFSDCRRDNYIPQWWNGVADRADATEIDVTSNSVTSGVDAVLAAGCPGLASLRGNQLLGTSDAETLTGTAGDDVICGFGGNDELVGAGGRDFLIGGAGNDTARGGAGPDRAYGGVGRDSLYGRAGSDLLVGGHGDDVCSGGAGADRARSCEVEHGI